MSLEQIPDELDVPVVVIDVLRAFSTAPWVFAGGASALYLAASRADALDIKDDVGAGAVCITDRSLTPGFDLGNSPGQARAFDLAGRPVVQTTTNGTVGVFAARHAPLVLCAGLVTATATARMVAAFGARRVLYVITGDGGDADEDVACADLIHAIVSGDRRPGDTAARVRRSRAAGDLRAAVVAGYRGVDADDIGLACEIDRFDFALEARHRDGKMQVFRASG